MIALLANRYVWAGAAILALIVTGWLWLSAHDREQQRIGQERCQAAVAQAVADGEAKLTAALNAAQVKAQEELDHVAQDNQAISATNADLQRRIDALRVRLAAQTGSHGLPPAGSHPGPADPVTSPASNLSISLAEVAAECAGNYAQVANQLEAIGRLTR